MIKKFTVSAIIGLGIAGLIFVIQKPQNTAVLSEKSANQTAAVSQNNTDLKDILVKKPLVEKLDDKNSLTPPKKSPDSRQNLTNILTETVGKTIAFYNPDGPLDVNGQKGIQVPDAELAAEDVLAKAAQKFNLNDLKPLILDSSLNIIKDASPQALIEYLFIFDYLTKTAAQKSAFDFSNEKMLVPELERAYALQVETINRFYKLPVPRPLLKIHKKEIELLTIVKNIYEKILSYQNDPVTSILAAQEMENIDTQFENLEKEIQEFIHANLGI